MEKELGRNEMCWCGSGLKYKTCHSAIDDKIIEYKRKGFMVPRRSLIKTKDQIKGIRESGIINTNLLDYITDKLYVGMSTEEIDNLIHARTLELGGIPAPLGFEGFPKSVCTSLNNEVCHGIPSNQVILKEGDIINIDVSTYYNGFYSDSSRMFCIGKVSAERKKLVQIAHEAIERGLSQIKPWQLLGDMGHCIHDYVLLNGYSVVEEIGGHGIGLEFHEEPFVSFCSPAGTGMLLVPGMVFTIEPMVNAGKSGVRIDRMNGWTVYTKDGADSAQWEVTVAVTESGFEILAF
jgi:methionyl aminopeptidase